MNLQKARILLEKINRLYKSMSLDEDNVAPIEIDLMKDYIKQLYESFLEQSPARELPKRTKPVPKSKFSSAVEIKKDPVIPPPAPKKVVEAPKTVKKVEKVVEEPAPPVKEEKPAPALVKEKITVTPEKPAPAPEPSFEPVKTPTRPASASQKIKPNHTELFEMEEVKELSQKLSAQPIKDLHKAMGLNERVFTINELFGGDPKLFRITMDKLNSFSTFEEAKVHLSHHLADQYKWTSRKLKTKAKNFVKMVRRRYI